MPGVAAVSKGLGDSNSMLRTRLLAVPDRVSKFNSNCISTLFFSVTAYYIHSFIHVGQIILSGMSPSQSNGLQFNMTEDFPKTVARTLNQGSVPTTMDFHPIQQTLLLG